MTDAGENAGATVVPSSSRESHHLDAAMLRRREQPSLSSLIAAREPIERPFPGRGNAAGS